MEKKESEGKRRFQRWEKINKSIIMELYYHFLTIFNHKYKLAIERSEELYNDFARYLYDNTKDDSGSIYYRTYGEYNRRQKYYRSEEDIEKEDIVFSSSEDENDDIE